MSSKRNRRTIKPRIALNEHNTWSSLTSIFLSFYLHPNYYYGIIRNPPLATSSISHRITQIHIFHLLLLMKGNRFALFGLLNRRICRKRIPPEWIRSPSYQTRTIRSHLTSLNVSHPPEWSG
ncbi:hypothetical protein F4813DRAFT_363047 [Daldinia decipiens]|uniref:uncharacterized protein n=1 Tax=Daldinia decipiens TaxID=326647 RepID=UPI0020C59B79|nr:uncharacterized protein F4813DRAFT_363047 [Daldinia decipiens]KAI1656733.1 hypothetical protein F4813DRAFT_363047 [Daldinia decipiens]